jgi:hypothetical protein
MKAFLRIDPSQSFQALIRLTSPVLLMGLVASAGPAEPATLPAKPPAPEETQALREIVFLKSDFVDAPSGGKDPFFPNTRRFDPKPPEVFQATPLDILKNLFLKGICGRKDRMLALINNRTLEVGEEGEYRQGGLAIRIRVVEITDKSVSFTIDGSKDRLELRLREGL